VTNALTQCHSLKELSMDYNDLGDKGAMALAEAMVHLPNLESLGVFSNGIGNTGGLALAAAIPQCPQLTYVNMLCNSMDGAVADQIKYNAQHNRKLEKMWENMQHLALGIGEPESSLYRLPEDILTLVARKAYNHVD